MAGTSCDHSVDISSPFKLNLFDSSFSFQKSNSYVSYQSKISSYHMSILNIQIVSILIFYHINKPVPASVSYFLPVDRMLTHIILS